MYPKPEANLSPKRPGDIADDQHKNVLIVGRPGIGKTLFCMKFTRDWASDRLFDEAQNSELRFDVAFLVRFRRLNSTAELNLRKLLDKSEFSTHVNGVVWNYIRENPSKVLFIFDEIDEFSARKKIQEDDSIYKDTVEKKNAFACIVHEDRGTQPEYSSKPLKHSIVKRILAFKR